MRGLGEAGETELKLAFWVALILRLVGCPVRSDDICRERGEKHGTCFFPRVWVQAESLWADSEGGSSQDM